MAIPLDSEGLFDFESLQSGLRWIVSVKSDSIYRLLCSIPRIYAKSSLFEPEKSLFKLSEITCQTVECVCSLRAYLLKSLLSTSFKVRVLFFRE